MRNRILNLLMLLLVFVVFFGAGSVNAASDGVGNMTQAKVYIDQALDKASTDLVTSKQAYDQFHDQWFDIEDTVKVDSKAVYRDIEKQMGLVEYAFMANKQQDVVTELQKLQEVTERYIQGQ